MDTRGSADASTAAKQPVSIGKNFTVMSTLCLIAGNIKQRVSLEAIKGQSNNVRCLCCLCCLFSSDIRRNLKELLLHSGV